MTRILTFGGALLVVLAFVADATGIIGYIGVDLFGKANLASVQIEGPERNRIVAFDQDVQPLWDYVEPNTMIRKATVADVDNDGILEVVAATHELAPPRAEDRPGHVLVFSAEGDLLVDHDTWLPNNYDSSYSDQLNVSDFNVTDLTGDGVQEIVVVSRDVFWFVSKISVYHFENSGLNEVSTFWNPGLLHTLYASDLNNDGIQEVVTTGENNSLQFIVENVDGNVPSIAVFAGDNISGQAPPEEGRTSDGSQLWYGFVPPPVVGISEIDFIDVDQDGIKEFQVISADACSWYVDFFGSIVRHGRGNACKETTQLWIIPHR